MRNATTHIIVHHTATPPSMDIGVAEIRQWHRQNGWRDVGYHWVIRRDGTIEAGRHEATAGAHCAAKGMNSVSIGIALVGGLKAGTTRGENNFTPAQFDALERLIREIWARYGRQLTVAGHKDFDRRKPECPAFDLKAFVAERLTNDKANTKNEQKAGNPARVRGSASGRAASPGGRKPA